MQFHSKAHISPLHAIGPSVAYCVECPARSRRVVGANPIWNSDFFPSFQLMLFLSFNMKDLGRTKEFAFIVENQTPPPTHPRTSKYLHT